MLEKNLLRLLHPVNVKLGSGLRFCDSSSLNALPKTMSGKFRRRNRID